ncbi:MAG: hotdog domain-containing protein [Actinomycetes bacterium]
MPVRPGLSATVQLTVSESDTAIAFRSGDVPVLATPRVIALLEEATVMAVRHELTPGSSTVGVRVQVEHISPTPVGGHITAEAHLEKVEGRRLIFHVSARDERGLIAAGKVTRVLIDIERFLEKTH